MNSLTKSTLIAVSVLSLAGVVGCGDRSAENAGRQIDQAAAKADRKMDQTAEKAERKMDQVADEASRKMDQAKADIKQGAAKAEASASDAALTAKVKTALIGEPGVKALQIDVDTNNGSVTL